jgi:hypothetical protein
MFTLIVCDRNPPPRVRQQAVASLGRILTCQAALALQDVRQRREYFLALRRDPSREPSRIMSIDFERTETLLAFFGQVTRDPGREAERCLDTLLSLVGGCLVALEFARDRLGARVTPSQVQDRNLRILLLPEGQRRRRIQIQEVDTANPSQAKDAMPRCYGDAGYAYMGWALNRLDLRTLFLTTVAYLREN